MTYAARFMIVAADDLYRLYAFVAHGDDADVERAARALTAIVSGIATLPIVIVHLSQRPSVHAVS